MYTLGILDGNRGIDSPNKLGLSPLMQAAQAGNAPVVRALLGRRPKIDARDKLGRTALMYATSAGNTVIARLLIARGADVNANGKYDMYSPLMLAVHSVRQSPSERCVMQIFSPAHLSLIRLLLAKGAGTHTHKETLNTALIYAAYHNRRTVVKLLLSRGGNVNVQNSIGYTALIMAAVRGHARIVKELLTAGADVNTVTRRGHSALWMVLRRGNLAVAELLRQAGATEPVGWESRGRTPKQN